MNLKGFKGRVIQYEAGFHGQRFGVGQRLRFWECSSCQRTVVQTRSADPADSM